MNSIFSGYSSIDLKHTSHCTCLLADERSLLVFILQIWMWEFWGHGVPYWQPSTQGTCGRHQPVSPCRDTEAGSDFLWYLWRGVPLQCTATTTCLAGRASRPQHWFWRLPGAVLLLRLPLCGKLLRLSATPLASHAQSGEEGRLLLQRLFPQIWFSGGSCIASP